VLLSGLEGLREQVPKTTISNAKGRLSRAPAPLSVIQMALFAEFGSFAWHCLAPSGTLWDVFKPQSVPREPAKLV